MEDGADFALSRSQTLILAGAGHVHLYLAAHAGELVARGARVVLVDPGEFWYSGLATGMLGVFGVRQAACIHANLLASLERKPLTEYHPQKRFLAILNLGDATALATWGPFWWHGRSSMWLKDFIDRRFLENYRRLASPHPAKPER